MQIGICSLIKNEHLYLEEWIKHHLSIGINKIFLYEDVTSLSHKSITIKFPEVELIPLLNILNESISDIVNIPSFEEFNIKQNRQLILWDYFCEKYKNQLDWCAFIDIDEFIMLEDNLTLNNLLSSFEGKNAVYLCWKIYNSNGFINKPNSNSIIETYKETVKINNATPFVHKNIVNMNKNKIIWENQHVIENGVCTNGLGINHNTCCYEKAWINHYFTKSWEEWCVKVLKRGDVNAIGLRLLKEFFIYNPFFIKREKELLNLVEGYKEKWEREGF